MQNFDKYYPCKIHDENRNTNNSYANDICTLSPPRCWKICKSNFLQIYFNYRVIIITCGIVQAQITNITIKVDYVNLHSVEGDPDNSIKVEKTNTDQSPPNHIDSMVDMIMGISGSSGNSGEPQRVT